MRPTAHSLSLTLRARDESRPVTLAVTDLIIAGWTGRDQTGLEAHIRELEAMGVSRPVQIPMFYRVGASLLTTSSCVEVVGQESTGEVEFVLFNHGNALWLGVGSDHTDRKVETAGVTLSKQMCPKPVARAAWALVDVESHWDELILRSYVTSGGRRSLYQEGKVSAIRRPQDLVARYQQRNSVDFHRGMAMFCGTLPVMGDIRWAERFCMELEDPVLVRRITHSYDIKVLPIEG